MNTAIIMLGSNINAEQNLKLSVEKLSGYFEIISQSFLLITKPCGEKYRSDFLNRAIKLGSNKTDEETVIIFKQIEREMGRTKESKQEGIIQIDIDLIFWNGILKHEDYNRFDFVKKCVEDVER